MKSLKSIVTEGLKSSEKANITERYQKREPSEKLNKNSSEYKNQEELLYLLQNQDGVKNPAIFQKKNWTLGVIFDYENETYHAHLHGDEKGIDLYYYTPGQYSQHPVKEKPFKLDRPYNWAKDEEGE